MTLRAEYVEYMPEKKQDGILYISDRFQLAIHNCPCGCGAQSVTPLGGDGWDLTRADGTVTLRPSILNRGCGAHYWITRNEVVSAD